MSLFILDIIKDLMVPVKKKKDLMVSKEITYWGGCKLVGEENTSMRLCEGIKCIGLEPLGGPIPTKIGPHA